MFGAKMGDLLSVFAVAPLAGARVEIDLLTYIFMSTSVAPLAGARVEIVRQITISVGVKVAPLAGARVEMILSK